MHTPTGLLIELIRWTSPPELPVTLLLIQI